MTKLRVLIAALFLAATMSISFAQEDEGTYIDNFGPKDSSYAQTDLLDFSDESVEEEKDNSGLMIGIGVAVVVVAAGAFFVMKKKK